MKFNQHETTHFCDFILKQRSIAVRETLQEKQGCTLESFQDAGESGWINTISETKIDRENRQLFDQSSLRNKLQWMV